VACYYTLLFVVMCLCIYPLIDDLGYATETLDSSLMNTVERELVDRDLKIHMRLTKLLRIHPGDAAVQEHGLAAMEHLGKH